MANYNVTISDFTPVFAAFGAAAAIILTAIGAAIGSAKTFNGIASIAAKRVDLVYKGMVGIVMCGVISIYGLVVAVIIINNLSPNITLYRSLLSMYGGLAVGLTGISSCIAIGVVSDSGVRVLADQSKAYCGMVMSLIFCEAIALYGLIVALLLCTL